MANRHVTLFLCGDVMTGRGIDQILPHAGDPLLYEWSVKDARTYVQLAERHSGPIPYPVDFRYIWGDGLEELNRFHPDLRLINLETAVTTSGDAWAGKEVHYRMNPPNLPCLTAAGIDCCALANNHVLDWGYAGLDETLQTLKSIGLTGIGAGQNLKEAQQPAMFDLPQSGRLLIFSMGSPTSGIPYAWGATENRSGVHLIDESTPEAASHVGQLIEHYRQRNDLVVVSIHWGPNWDYEIPQEQQVFAHTLIDHFGVNLIYGHSSHHVKGIEVHRNRPILYGSGDLLTDYEGIKGYEHYRGDLSLLYFVTLNAATGDLVRLEMQPTQMRRLQVKRANFEGATWLAELLNREGRWLGTRVEWQENDTLSLRWD
jgi:poly-gamma-glutamate capsule biosynthesis protein CapA/YwtB (metallophosphatase superfamily)